MDPVLLSRLQFAMTICFHFLFPPLTIGLSWMIVVFEGLAWRTGADVYRRTARFFAVLFGITFGVGVASGIVMEFQFGTNWANYARFVGDIFGAPLAIECIFAFFLESGFLGLYLFGRKRLSPAAHWVSILLVAIGATVSAFWIIVANSWQQTPAGYTINPELGRAELTDFSQAVFNPSTLLRFSHTMMASFVSGALFVAGVGAALVLRRRDAEAGRVSLRLGLPVALIASLLLLFPTGHEHGRQVAHTQPEKFAALEGLYVGTSGAPLLLFALVDTKTPELTAEIQIPKMLSWMTFGDPDALVRGLSDFPPDQVPKGAELWFSFVSFHNMVILGMLFIGLTALSVFLLRKDRLLRTPLLLKALVVAIPLPLLACQFGWIAAEVGRQPWAVYKLLRTSHAVSPNVIAGNILFSFVLMALIYAGLGTVWAYIMVRKIRSGPASPEGARAA